MKKLLALTLVLAMLLCGCDMNAPTNTGDETKGTAPVATEPDPTEPEASHFPLFSNYEKDSALETQTGGAVGVYSLEKGNHYAVAPMGESILLFSGGEETILTAYSETGVSTKTLECFIVPDTHHVQINQQGVAYYNEADQSVVFLDTSLKETSRIMMPGDLIGGVALSADRKSAYYFGDDGLRRFDLESGISRLLKECSFLEQDVVALHFDDSVLECSIHDGQQFQTMLVDTVNGNMIYMGEEFPVLYTEGDAYFARWYDSVEIRDIVGTRGGTNQWLDLPEEPVGEYPMLQRQGAAMTYFNADGSSVDYYDLTTGKCTASVELNGVWSPIRLTADTRWGMIWFLGGSADEKTDTLYCWDTTLSPAEETESYFRPNHTDENPDVEGLEECIRAAQEMASQYRIRIRIWDDALDVMPDDYTYTVETGVHLYQKYLEILEGALSIYPKEIFKELGNSSENDYLTISLVRGIVGSTELGSLELADGIHFWKDGSSYMVLAMNDMFEETFHHEFFHAMDSYILTETLAYDFWNDLNPSGFAYDYNYIANMGREDWQYLEDEDRSFIDMYSMSFPKEDRARIMQYAVMPDNSSYFQSSTMQNKLETLCDGIREAFDLDDTYLWEQYLN